PSQLAVLPSSHSSPASTTPSPHDARRHVVRQASGATSLFAAPSSHSSQPGARTPSPQTALPGAQSVTTFADATWSVTQTFANRPSRSAVMRNAFAGAP